MRAHGEAGARLTWSTMSWSPTRMVLAMDAEGITKFCATKAYTNRTLIAVTQSEAKDCRPVSGGCVFWVGFVIVIPPAIGLIHPALVVRVLAFFVGVDVAALVVE